MCSHTRGPSSKARRSAWVSRKPPRPLPVEGGQQPEVGDLDAVVLPAAARSSRRGSPATVATQVSTRVGPRLPLGVGARAGGRSSGSRARPRRRTNGSARRRAGRPARPRRPRSARRPSRPQPGGIVELEIGPHDGLGHLGYLADRAARGSWTASGSPTRHRQPGALTAPAARAGRRRASPSGARRRRRRYSRRDGHIRRSAQTPHAGRWAWHVRRPWRRRLTWNSSSAPRGVMASICVVQRVERRARARAGPRRMPDARDVGVDRDVAQPVGEQQHAGGGLAPDAGQRARGRPAPRRPARRQSRATGRRLGSPIASRIALIRTDLTFEMPPGRIASSISSTGASRTASQASKRSRRRRKATSRLRSLVDCESTVRTSSAIGSPCGSITGSRRSRAGARGPRARGRLGVGARRSARGEVSSPRRWTPRSPSTASSSSDQPALLAQRRRRRAAVLYLHGVADELGRLGRASSSAPAAWRPTCPASGAAASAATATSRCPATTAFVETLPRPRRGRARAPGRARLGRRRAAVGAALPRARRAPRRDQRRAAAARLSLAPRRAPVAHAAASARWPMGSPTRWALRGAALPAAPARPTTSWPHFDHGTQRAILQLLPRDAPRTRSRAPASSSGDIDCPALVVWGDRDPYLPSRRSPTPTRRARRRGRRAAPPRRRALALARPAGCRRSHRRVPGRLAPIPAWALAAVRWRAPTSCWRPPSADLAAQEYRARPRPRAVGQRLVRRPSHARLQRALPAAGARCSARGWSAR